MTVDLLQGDVYFHTDKLRGQDAFLYIVQRYVRDRCI